MSEVITIPKKLVQKDDLVILPRKDYEEFLRLRLRREWEEKDTNEDDSEGDGCPGQPGQG